MRKFFAAVERWFSGGHTEVGERMERVAVAPARPAREPILAQFRNALGIRPSEMWADIGKEAEARVRLGIAPGRVTITGERNEPRIVQYASSIEAGLDFRLWQIEVELQNAESVLAAARDDVAAGWGDEAALGRAQRVAEGWRTQVRTAQRLAPLGEYVATNIALVWSRMEFAMLTPDPMIHRYAPVDVPTPRGTSAHPFRAAEAHDHGRAAAMRQASRENALQYQATPYVMARLAVQALETKRARWIEQNPMLHAMLEADFERGFGIGW